MSSDRISMKVLAAAAACVGTLLGAVAPAHAALTIVINNVNVVPEPASALLALGGLAAVGRAATRCRST